MTHTNRFVSLAAVLSFSLASATSAQSLATFGSAELGGFGEGSALLGVSMSTGTLGWGPVGTVVGQTYRYYNGQNAGQNVYANAYAISPSVGIQNSMQDGNYNFQVGYTFVNTEFSGIVSGSEVGGKNGVFVSAQGNYWGDGENTAQAIGAWGFADDYYWTRFRAAHRLSTPLYLGGEVVLQGQQSQTVGNFTVPSQMRYEVGPTIEYRFTPDFRVGASGGLRAGNNNVPSSGYARIEFLLLTKLGGM